MKKRFTEGQIIGVLKQAEAGLPVKELCRQHGISEATYYNWTSKYGGMTESEAQRLRARAGERQAQADRRRSDVGYFGIEGRTGPKVVSPQARRAAVDVLMTEHKIGVTRACGLIGISRSLYRYRSRRVGDDEVRTRMQEIAVEKRRYGYQRIHVVLRREGWLINHKRTLRLYREAGLAVLRRKRKRIAWVERRPHPKPTAPDVTWSMDFVSDALADGRRIRCLNIVDNYTRECLAMEVDTSLSGRRVAKVLDRLRDLRGLPLSITVDNGPEWI